MQNLPYGHIVPGDSPVVVVTPHTGTSVPQALLSNPAWRPIEGRLADPFGALLREAALEKGVTCVSAHFHPCVIDFNVALDSRPLSTRLNRVGLCRTHTSRGEALYQQGQEPSEEEVIERAEAYWKPFHAAVAREVLRLRKLHANVLLLVSHASAWLSPYREQPGAADCNVGTNRGLACDRRLVAAITESAQAAGRSWVVNGKFADAFAAQHYGLPVGGVHAIEVEVSGRWRLDCEQRRVAQPDSEFAGDGAEPRAMLDALESVLKALPTTDRPLYAGSAPQGLD